jgi:hypothetical protein
VPGSPPWNCAFAFWAYHFIHSCNNIYYVLITYKHLYTVRSIAYKCLLDYAVLGTLYGDCIEIEVVCLNADEVVKGDVRL